MAPTDTELINKTLNGDAFSFNELVARYDRKVLSIALKYSNNEDDAKDIYQEVFIRVFRSLKNFKFKSEFSTWLFRVTTNVCLTYKMRMKKNMNVSIDNEFEDEENETKTRLELVDQENSPEKQAINSEIFDNINYALNSLTPRQKMIFILKHYEGHKIKDISLMMDVGEGTVKKYLFEAVHKLRKELQEIYG